MSRSSLSIGSGPGTRARRDRSGQAPVRRLVVAAVAALALMVPLLSVLASPASADTAPVAPVTVPTVSADPLPTVQINGVAWDQVIVGNTVYVTGEFTSARPAGAAAGTNETPRSNLLAYNLTTGALITSWAPTLNAKGAVIAASADGSRIFVGGSFTQVSGVNRYRVVALDATTGAVISNWNVVANTRVRSLAVSGTTLYLGGVFTTIGNQPRSGLAAVSTTTGALLPWAPSANAEVMALTAPPGSGKVVAGGKFDTISGAPAYGMAALDATTGQLLPWAIGNVVRNAGTEAAIYSLSSDSTQVYGTGYTFGSGGNFEGTFAAKVSDGAEVYVTGCRGDTYDATPVGGVLYSVGHPHDCSTINGLPQTDPWTYQRAQAQTITAAPSGLTNQGGNFNGHPAPELLHWLPDMMAGTFTGAGQAAWTIEGNSNYVVLGGEFPRVNNTPQYGLVRFAVRSIAPNAQGPRDTAEMTPTMLSLTSGRVRVSWKSAWDRDNRQLTYDVLRGPNLASSVSIATLTQDSNWWNRPQMFFNDQGAAPGSTQTYRIRVRDALGNTVTGSPASITVPAGGTSSVYASQVLNDGASHLWRLGEASGTVAYDYVAADDLTVESSATRGADGAMVNDGTARSTTFVGNGGAPAATPNPVAGPQAYGSEAWFRTTTTSGGKILGFGDSRTGTSGNYDRHIWMLNDGRIAYGVNGNGLHVVVSPQSYNDGQWHQVVAGLGTNGAELFIDGKRVGRDTGASGAQPFNGYWRIGGDNLGGWPNQPSSNAFAGGIEDVAVYPAPLTLAQVQSHYQASGRSLNLPARPTDAYGAAVWDAGASLYWRLDETTGTAAIDRMTNEAAGTYSAGILRGEAGSPAATAGTSVRFPGGSGQTVVASTQVNNPTVYSLETWFRTTTTHGGRLIGFGSAPSGNSDHYDRHVWMLNDGTLRYGIYTGNTDTVTSPQAYNDGQWHQVVATQGSGGMRLYVDGALVASGSAVSPENYAGYWRLGSDNTWGGSDTNDFAGSFDEAAVYDSVLPAATVAQHYQLGAPAPVNQAPTAAFTSTTAALTASFDAAASTDPDGTIDSYSWQFGDGRTGTGVSPDHTYATAGSYDAVLTVTDDDGASATVTHPVTVTQPANVLPTAAFTVTRSKLKATFDASGSTDPDGTIASYAWDFGDGQNGTTATPTHTYTATGTYTAVLTVTDNRGGTATVSHGVTVTANAAPAAAFSTTCTNLACAFTAAGSDDADGTIASYSWNFGDGTATGTGVSPNHTYATAGSRNVTLTVTDNDGATDSTTQPVTVAAANNSPTAALTSTGTGLSRSFDGSGSSDSDGTIASYRWDFGDGSADSTGVSPNHTWTAAGSYTVTLTVTDNQGATGTASEVLTLTAPNQAPVARFSSTCTALDCSFTAAASSDADGSIPTYAWTFGDGATGSGVAPTHHYAAGSYNVTLTVTDDDGATGTVTHPVTPAPTPNQTPTAAFTTSCTDLGCGFDASASTDPDGSILGYAWTFGDGQSGTGVTTTHPYTAAGTYAVALTVTDDDGATRTLSKNVTVTAAPVNQPPVAAFTAACTNLACTVDASTSSDPDGTVTGYSWAFGDTSSATGRTAAHTYAAAGSYNVVLTVTDNQGATTSITRVVTVTAVTGPVTLASDAFGRTVAGGFGSADSGGAWTFTAAGATGSVTGGSARLSVPAGRTSVLRLAGVSNLSTDVTHTVWTEAVPTGGGAYLSTLVRATAAGDYGVNVKLLSTGVVNIGLVRSVNGTGTTIGTPVNVSGLTNTAGKKLKVRVQAVGSSPTTIRAKVWASDSAEPANWTVSATDGTAGFQTAGSVGLSAYVSGSATAPVVVRYDDFVATSTN